MTVQVKKTIVLQGRKWAHTSEDGDKEQKSWSRAEPTQTAALDVLLRWKGKGLRWDRSQGWNFWWLSVPPLPQNTYLFNPQSWRVSFMLEPSAFRYIKTSSCSLPTSCPLSDQQYLRGSQERSWGLVWGVLQASLNRMRKYPWLLWHSSVISIHSRKNQFICKRCSSKGPVS